MSPARCTFLFFLFAVALLPSLGGCSKSADVTLSAEELSQVPPEQQVFDFAAKGELDKLKKLLAANPTLLQSRGNFDWTPLHYAAAYGQNAVVKYLLNSGADAKAEDENSFEPVAIAAQRNHPDTVKIFREAAGNAAPASAG